MADYPFLPTLLLVLLMISVKVISVIHDITVSFSRSTVYIET